jgi:HAD superfamily hydrolase (TIGR01490 family)
MPENPSTPETNPSDVAAIWDVDFSMIPRTSVERLFVYYLWKRGGLRYRDLARMLRGVLLDSRGPFTLRLKTTKMYLAGRPIRETEHIAKVFVADRLHPAVASEAKRLLDDHRRKGHRILLLTGGPEFLIRPLAEDLGIESVIGTRLEERDGCWTGRLIPPHPYGEEKRRLLQVWASDRGVRLADSYAYADSLADLAVLEAVGYPHVVNPGRRMRRIASSRGWPVLDW